MSEKFVLIIEDNAAIGDVYATTLDMINLRSEIITNGKDALDRLDDIVPDLIMLDMNLPEVSGHYIYKKIRADPRLHNCRVIVATANNLVAQMISKDLDRADRLMMKPIAPRQLLDVVEALSIER